MYQRDPIKAKMRRRIVMGIREVTKHLKLKKLKCVIISPNLEKIQSKGDLLQLCALKLVPFHWSIFGYSHNVGWLMDSATTRPIFPQCYYPSDISATTRPTWKNCTETQQAGHAPRSETNVLLQTSDYTSFASQERGGVFLTRIQAIG